MQNLIEAEAVIAECGSDLEKFERVGLALMAIRDNRWYLESANNFEMYCKQRWGYTPNYAYKLLASARIVQELRDDPSIEGECVPLVHTEQVLPATERVARELSVLPTAQARREVWQQAVETAPVASNGAPHVTASGLREIVHVYTGKISTPRAETIDQINRLIDPIRYAEPLRHLARQMRIGGEVAGAIRRGGGLQKMFDENHPDLKQFCDDILETAMQFDKLARQVLKHYADNQQEMYAEHKQFFMEI